jgi:hypothetical protein
MDSVLPDKERERSFRFSVGGSTGGAGEVEADMMLVYSLYERDLKVSNVDFSFKFVFLVDQKSVRIAIDFPNQFSFFSDSSR